MNNFHKTLISAFAAAFLTGCESGAFIDTTASVIGGVVDGVADLVDPATEESAE